MKIESFPKTPSAPAPSRSGSQGAASAADSWFEDVLAKAESPAPAHYPSSARAEGCGPKKCEEKEERESDSDESGETEESRKARETRAAEALAAAAQAADSPANIPWTVPVESPATGEAAATDNAAIAATNHKNAALAADFDAAANANPAPVEDATDLPAGEMAPSDNKTATSGELTSGKNGDAGRASALPKAENTAVPANTPSRAKHAAGADRRAEEPSPEKLNLTNTVSTAQESKADGANGAGREIANAAIPAENLQKTGAGARTREAAAPKTTIHSTRPSTVIPTPTVSGGGNAGNPSFELNNKNGDGFNNFENSDSTRPEMFKTAAGAPASEIGSAPILQNSNTTIPADSANIITNIASQTVAAPAPPAPEAASGPAAPPASEMQQTAGRLSASARETADSILKQISVHLRPGATEMRLHLDPAGLGELKIRFVYESGKLKARVRTELESTAELVRARESELRAAMNGAGIQISDLDIGHGKGGGRRQETPAERQESFSITPAASPASVKITEKTTAQNLPAREMLSALDVVI